MSNHQCVERLCGLLALMSMLSSSLSTTTYRARLFVDGVRPPVNHVHVVSLLDYFLGPGSFELKSTGGLLIEISLALTWFKLHAHTMNWRRMIEGRFADKRT